MRHFLFVAPPLTVLGAIGIDASWRLLQSWRRPAAGALAAVIAIWLAWNAVTLARLHPYQYLDYNTLVGGLPGAARGYVMDYWVNVLPEALNELQAYLDRPAPDSPWPKKQRYDVAVCGEKPPFEAVKYPDMQWAADWDRADFYVAPTHMGCETLMQGPMIARISRMGVAIGVVKDIREHRRAVAAARGSQ
jgi:hypothetical protein